MKLINKNSNQVITNKIQIANSLLEKTVGLLGKKEPQSLYFTTRWGIHTFGMKFPLTILICDDNLKVQKIISHLKINRICFWNPLYQHVFELPLKEYDVKIGDILEFQK